MGGVDWKYVVPYQEDVDKALQALRQDVFIKGEYQRPNDALDGFDDIDGTGFSTIDDEQERQSIIALYQIQPLNVLIERVGIGGLREEVRSLINAPKLSSLDELEALLCLSTAGTSSILDIKHVAPALGPGTVTALPPEKLFKLFGTDKPTHSIIESNSGFYDAIGRGESIYIIAYEDDKPHEIYFAGYSYD